MREISGDHSGGETPVPIPNTAVKPTSADGTALATGWESRSLPGISLLFFLLSGTADAVHLRTLADAGDVTAAELPAEMKKQLDEDGTRICRESAPRRRLTSRQKRWWPGILCSGPSQLESARPTDGQALLDVAATSWALTMARSANQPYKAKDDESDEPRDANAGSDTASEDSADEPDQREQVEERQRPCGLPPPW